MRTQATECRKGDIQDRAKATLAGLPIGAWINLLAILIAGLLISVLVGCGSGPEETPPPPTSTPETPAAAATPSVGDTGTPSVRDTGTPTLVDAVAAQTRHFQGEADAPVTIIEFGDFQ